jgi:hypothetical protein
MDTQLNVHFGSASPKTVYLCRPTAMKRIVWQTNHRWGFPTKDRFVLSRASEQESVFSEFIRHSPCDGPRPGKGAKRLC